MKFLSICVFLILNILLSVCKSKNSGRLTLEENEERLTKCGNDGLPFGGVSLKLWYWLAYIPGNSNGKRKYPSAATMISSRHFLTSSHTIINENMKWREDKKTFDGKCLKGGSKSAEVPVPVLSSFNITTMLRDSTFKQSWNNLKVRIVKAYLLNICDDYLKKRTDFRMTFSPMLVEVEATNPKDSKDLEMTTPCVNHNKTNVKEGDSVRLDKIMEADVTEIQLKITRKYPEFLTTNFHSEGQEFGSPLIKIINGSTTVIGMGTNGAPNENNETMYFDVTELSDDLLVGWNL